MSKCCCDETITGGILFLFSVANRKLHATPERKRENLNSFLFVFGVEPNLFYLFTRRHGFKTV